MKIQSSLTEFTLPFPGRGERTVRVFVPEHEEGELLPVIYMTDGQNLFEDDRPGQFGCWYTREAISEERRLSGKAAMIVGIHNDTGARERTNELTPGEIGEVVIPPDIAEEPDQVIIPEGELFDAFVVNVVMPAVEARFPVKKGRSGTAFCGSSSGGLQSFYTVLSHPDKFCAAGVFSPAFVLYAAEDIVRWTASKLCENAPYLYFYSGSGDHLESRIFESTEAVYDALIEFYPPECLNEIILPEEPHHEKAWSEVFRDFLHTFLAR